MHKAIKNQIKRLSVVIIIVILAFAALQLYQRETKIKGELNNFENLVNGNIKSDEIILLDLTDVEKGTRYESVNFDKEPYQVSNSEDVNKVIGGTSGVWYITPKSFIDPSNEIFSTLQKEYNSVIWQQFNKITVYHFEK